MYDGNNDRRTDRQFSEDPWDISQGVGGSRCRSVCLTRPLWLVWFAFGLGILLLAWSARVQAQPPPPPSDFERAPRKPGDQGRVVVTLKSDAGELAQDYLVLLEQLKILSADYSSYYSDFQQSHAEELEKTMRQLSRRLSDSAYFRDFSTLTFDLAQLQYELSKQESELAQLYKTAQSRGEYATEKVSPKLYKITRTLRREIEMLHDQLEDDIGERMRASAAKSAIVQQYIRASVVAMNGQGASDVRTIIVGTGDLDISKPMTIEIDLTTFSDLDELLQNCEQLEVYNIPGLQEPSDVIDPRDLSVYDRLPDLPSIRMEDQRTTFKHSSGEAGLTLQFIDSARIESAMTPVYVVNPMGTLRVEGWDRPWIMVDARVELSAESSENADALADRVDVRIHNRPNALYIELILPQLTDPKTSILSASIDIKAPRDNPLSLRNSHGPFVVRDFDNDVRLKADHCDIKLSDVDGKVEVVNRMGSITITDVSGRLEVRNARGPLTVTGGRGDMTLENSLALIDIRDCSGQVQIRNSGSVEVVDFVGDLRVDNNNGAVTVEDLVGSLDVTNSLQPVVVGNIRGAASLQNVRGTIQVDQIDGPLSIINSYGTISAASLSGPLQLVNAYGVINLAVDQSILGRSTIIADNGTVKLRLDESADVLLTVETIGGAIKSTFSTPIKTTDSSSTTRLELGRMAASLDISGNGADIVITSSN